jgi:hypothetical protein
MAPKLIPPQLGMNSFSCPHCGALSHQNWYQIFLSPYGKGKGPQAFEYSDVLLAAAEQIDDEPTRDDAKQLAERLRQHFVTYERNSATCDVQLINAAVSHCYSCDSFCVWVGDRLRYPDVSSEVVPHEDMPDDIREHIREAAEIVDQSPHAAAALLRLSIQRLMPHIGGKGDDLNVDIADLARKGLEPEIQQAMHILRVVGNNAVRPGQIDLKDDKATALNLFALLNLIIERRITVQKRIDELSKGLRESAPASILHP